MGWLNVLAQRSTGSDVTNFWEQASGLIIVTCGLGLLWVGLMWWISRRSAERRRRKKEGLPPLPGLHETIIKAVNTWLNPESGAPPLTGDSADSRASPAETPPDIPMPDLDMLVDWDEPEPVPIPTPPPDVAPEPELAPDPFVDSYPVVEAYPAASAPAQDFPVEEEVPIMAQTPGAPPDAVELLRVWRDLSDGSLIVEIGGRHFKAVQDLRGTDLERRFINVVRDLTAMARAAVPSAPQAPPARPAAPTAPAAPTPAATSPSASRGEAPTSPAASTTSTNDMPMPDFEDLTTQSMTPGSMLRQMTRAAMGNAPEPIEHAPILTVAEQIEERLQARLPTLPAFRNRSIHVRQAPGGGVRIEVDGTFFDGVGEVDDDEVRELIIDVVREWENSQ